MPSEWSEMKRSAMQRLANSGDKNDWRCTRLAKNMSGGALSSYPLMPHTPLNATNPLFSTATSALALPRYGQWTMTAHRGQTRV